MNCDGSYPGGRDTGIPGFRRGERPHRGTCGGRDGRCTGRDDAVYLADGALCLFGGMAAVLIGELAAYGGGLCGESVFG